MSFCCNTSFNSYLTSHLKTINDKKNTIVDIVTASTMEEFTVNDITVCIAIRASEINPWVIERLDLSLDYYTPSPKFLIIDFGSTGDFKFKIKEICNKKHAEYLYIDDKDTFSASKARNIGGRHINTKFIFFSDIDFVFEQNIFLQLINLINSFNINSSPRKCIFMPIYHLSQAATEEYFSAGSNSNKNNFLKRISFEALGTPFKQHFSFVAPYSNTFLITKEFFELSGGYCDIFRGHGSEDFEYLIRLGLLSSNMPLPKSLDKDFYGPLKDSFWYSHDYAGFRKYLEAITLPSELHGIKAFHLYHESPREKGYWTAQNDWKRERFNSIIKSYYPNICNILSQDYLYRDKKALCIFSDTKSWGYFLPIRMHGYHIEILTSKDNNDIHHALNKVEKKYYDRIFIFNPYMKSHACFRGIIEVAKTKGVKVTCIERGGLPNSIYYSDEVVYGDKDYHDLDNILSTYTLENQVKSSCVLDRLISGKETLETQESYESTHSKGVLLRSSKKITIFVPLQLSDDMAVTKFNEGFSTYGEFIAQIKEAITNNSDIFFVIKKHPLSKEIINEFNFENVLIADEKANIHSLIDSCNATIVYNSGVGLISMLHGKPTFNIGNSYYSSSKSFSNSVPSVENAISKIKTGNYHITEKKDAIKFIDWLIHKKYSFFSAKNVIREFSDRRAHAYDNIVVESFILDDKQINIGSLNYMYDVSTTSYLNHRIYIFDNVKKSPTNVINTSNNNKKIVTSKSNTNEPLNICYKKIRKLFTQPKLFFKDMIKKYL